MWRYGVEVTVLWLLIAATSVSAVSFQGLGVPGGTASAVSADGTTVVGTSYQQAFRWTVAGGYAALPDVPGGPTESYGLGVSGDGSLIVGRGTDGSFHNYQAAKWPNSSTVIPLENLPSTLDNSSCALGISNDGSVIVGWCEDSTSYRFAVRWTESGGVEKLSGIGGDSSADDASCDGSIIVGEGKPLGGGMTQAFRWTEQSGPTYLGTLSNHNESYGHGVSADGAVVVGMSGRGGHDDYRAFKWTQAEGMVSLGLLPGSYNARARAASADGSRIVGGADSSTRAFLWDAQHGMRDLQLVLENELGLDLRGWRLCVATDISSDGNTIVGGGYNPAGLYEPWIAVIPEPASALLLVVGGLMLTRRRQS